MPEKNADRRPVVADVLTLTLNPAIDMTIGLDRLAAGEVNRAAAYHTDAGGKGINVAATLAAGGFKTAAAGILGRDNADFFGRFFAARNIDNACIYTEGATRTNIKIVSKTETTDINLPGLAAVPALLAEARHILAEAQAEFLVLSGSVPPQCPDSFYADFLEFYEAESSGKRAKCVVDCSGKPLKALLSGKARPFCIKPNNDELAEWAGRPLSGRDEILCEARNLQKTGIALVVVSMGSRGALFVADGSAFHAEIQLDKVESTVGAGDAMVAGIVAAFLRHSIPADKIDAAALEIIAREATLWAAGKLLCRGATLPPADIMRTLAVKISCGKLI